MSDPSNTTVVIATAMIPILDHNDNVIWFRALLDSGSTSSVATEKFAGLVKAKKELATRWLPRWDTASLVMLAASAASTSAVKRLAR
jgi:hypothetical protein